jgi:hypothetical protein
MDTMNETPKRRKPAATSTGGWDDVERQLREDAKELARRLPAWSPELDWYRCVV